MMLCVVASLLLILMTSRNIAMKRSDVIANATVRFHWSESNKRRNNTKYGADVRRRAAALDGQLATIMNPPFGPFWFHNKRRVVIQSLEDPNITLAVKLRNLELIQPIKIHVFHAKNDSSRGDEYWRKEMDILHDSNYSAVMTVHPYTNSSRWFIGISHSLLHGMGSRDDPYLMALHVLSRVPPRPNNQFDPRFIVEQVKNMLKDLISRFVWMDYQNMNGSKAMWTDWVSRYDPVFRTILGCQFGKVAQNNGNYTDMQWWKNDKMDSRMVIQGMSFVQDVYDRDLCSRIKKLGDDFPPSFEPEIKKELSLLLYSTALEATTDCLRICDQYLHRTHSWQAIIREMSKFPPNLWSKRERVKELGLIRNIGERYSEILASPEQGRSYAIVVSGDIIKDSNNLMTFLHQVQNRVGPPLVDFEYFDI